ncbi:MAG: SRPBCC family protein [Deltaproteobacteria bacterium]|nr:SRPBCC family protein [Deltaproteobacteria bacterium]
MRPCIVVTFFVLLALAAPSASAAPKVVSPLESGVDANALMPLLKRGELSLIESTAAGGLKQVTMAVLINAPSDKVFATITDYPNFKKFMPNIVECEVVKTEGDETEMNFEIDVPVSNLKYTLRHRHIEKRAVEISLVKGDIKTGSWRYDLHPVGDKTIMFYSLMTDVSETSWLVKKVLRAQPTMQHALNVATGIVIVKAVKKEAERR